MLSIEITDNNGCFKLLTFLRRGTQEKCPNSSQQPSPRQPLADSPTSRTGERTGRVGLRQFNRESKRHAHKQSERIRSLLPRVRQVLRHLQFNRAPSWIMVTRDDKFHHFKHPSTSSSSPLYALSINVI